MKTYDYIVGIDPDCDKSRDAALLAWDYAGFSMIIKPKKTKHEAD